MHYINTHIIFLGRLWTSFRVNMNPTCTHCESSTIVIDPSRGEYVCTDCGYVLRECVFGNEYHVDSTEYNTEPDEHVHALACSYFEHRFPCITYTHIKEFMSTQHAMDAKCSFANAIFNVGIQHGVDYEQLRREIEVFFPNACLQSESNHTWKIAIRHVCMNHSLSNKEYQHILNHCERYMDTHVEHLYHSVSIVTECMYIHTCCGGTITKRIPLSIRQCYEKMYPRIVK